MKGQIFEFAFITFSGKNIQSLHTITVLFVSTDKDECPICYMYLDDCAICKYELTLAQSYTMGSMGISHHEYVICKYECVMYVSKV